MMYEIGDIVVCVFNRGLEDDITLGKKYEVLDIDKNVQQLIFFYRL